MDLETKITFKITSFLSIFTQYNIDIRLAIENREYWENMTFEEIQSYIYLLVRLINGGIYPITAFEYAADDAIYGRISILSKYIESNSVIQNHKYWYELDDDEFELYFDRFISLVNADIEPIIALQYADDYQEKKSIEELISFKNQGLDTHTAWLLTNNSNDLVAAFFEFLALGFDENYAFECANEFHSYPDKKAYVIHLANMGIKDSLAYNIVHYFYDDKINLAILEHAFENKEQLTELYDTLIDSERHFPSQ